MISGVTTTAASLTARQEAFCLHYVQTRNGTQSALKAGYAPSCAGAAASRNLRELDVLARLRELEAAIPRPGHEEIAIAGIDERLKILTDIARHTIEMPVGAGHKTQAIAEINKMQHIYEPGSQSQQVNIVFVVGKGYDVPQLGEVSGKDAASG